ncbi:kinase-like protein [Violaceomyces palustris]|uniref:Kinase-like protein n=1 Tax=Violaceomyces palustris TaxID=1673888 RepID=A0ACD0P873_9BASI|nr:kinase-like protein [Violaceomyces palustris]
MTIATSSNSSVRDISGATDGLKLPLPPVSLEFPLREQQSSSEIQRHRYVRKGGSRDAKHAVIGRGGFGTVYKYHRDDSLTPNPSLDQAEAGKCTSTYWQPVHAPSSVLLNGDGEPDRKPTSSQLGKLGKVVPSFEISKESGQDPRDVASSKDPAKECRKKAPSIIVVKVCKTPSSGSYDELPKTKLADKKTRQAALRDDTGKHIRIVRGEARIFRYLQATQKVRNGVKDSHLVRLLADLPSRRPDGTEEPLPLDDTPPIRLLVFEKLVELGCDLKPDGTWAKAKTPWSREKVEEFALDIAKGLRFLHMHNVTHGDLKPSNLMRDPRTGKVKIIDLGASRRFIRLPNFERESVTVVEEVDEAHITRNKAVPTLPSSQCEGLGSLTGSPHYMAPEVLLQSSRYTSASGNLYSVLEDYELRPERLPEVEARKYFQLALTDFKRGWGIKADIWSWACTVLSLLTRTLADRRLAGSNTICPFPFDSETETPDTLFPMHSPASHELELPRFHAWSRQNPLTIMATTVEGRALPVFARWMDSCLLSLVRQALKHQDDRPTAAVISEILESDQKSRSPTTPTATSPTMRAATHCESSPSIASQDLTKVDDQIGQEPKLAKLEGQAESMFETASSSSDKKMEVKAEDEQVEVLVSSDDQPATKALRDRGGFDQSRPPPLALQQISNSLSEQHCAPIVDGGLEDAGGNASLRHDGMNFPPSVAHGQPRMSMISDVCPDPGFDLQSQGGLYYLVPRRTEDVELMHEDPTIRNPSECWNNGTNLPSGRVHGPARSLRKLPSLFGQKLRTMRTKSSFFRPSSPSFPNGPIELELKPQGVALSNYRNPGESDTWGIRRNSFFEPQAFAFRGQGGQPLPDASRSPLQLNSQEQKQDFGMEDEKNLRPPPILVANAFRRCRACGGSGIDRVQQGENYPPHLKGRTLIEMARPVSMVFAPSTEGRDSRRSSASSATSGVKPSLALLPSTVSPYPCPEGRLLSGRDPGKRAGTPSYSGFKRTTDPSTLSKDTSQTIASIFRKASLSSYPSVVRKR